MGSKAGGWTGVGRKEGMLALVGLQICYCHRWCPRPAHRRVASSHRWIWGMAHVWRLRGCVMDPVLIPCCIWRPTETYIIQVRIPIWWRWWRVDPKNTMGGHGSQGRRRTCTARVWRTGWELWAGYGYEGERGGVERICGVGGVRRIGWWWTKRSGGLTICLGLWTRTRCLDMSTGMGTGEDDQW